MKLAFFASHNGSNVTAILEACKKGVITAQPVLVISNNAEAPVLSRAQREGVATYHLSSKTHPDPDALDEAISALLQKQEVDLVVLAGYMRKLGSKTLAAYRNRVLNIHPALLPKFGGKGMYGAHVHHAVLQAGETESGATVHVVTEGYDEGPVVSQKRVAVLPGDTVESLAARVLDAEHQLYVETIASIASGALVIAP